MENNEVVLIRLEEREKSNTKRIDEHDKRLDSLEKTYSIMEKMDYRMGNVENAIDKIDKKIDEKVQNDSTEKGKKWDKLVDYIFYTIISLFMGYMAIQFGIK